MRVYPFSAVVNQSLGIILGLIAIIISILSLYQDVLWNKHVSNSMPQRMSDSPQSLTGQWQILDPKEVPFERKIEFLLRRDSFYQPLFLIIVSLATLIALLHLLFIGKFAQLARNKKFTAILLGLIIYFLIFASYLMGFSLGQYNNHYKILVNISENNRSRMRPFQLLWPLPLEVLKYCIYNPTNSSQFPEPEVEELLSKISACQLYSFKCIALGFVLAQGLFFGLAIISHATHSTLSENNPWLPPHLCEELQTQIILSEEGGIKIKDEDFLQKIKAYTPH